MKKLKKVALVGLTIGLFAAGYSSVTIAQHAGSTSAHQHSANTEVATIPREAGQSGFAALAEIVALMEGDPDTNWTKVDISRLREHLVDMDALVLRAEVTVEILSGRAEFTVTGSDITLRAIHAMVPAHAAELDKLPEWSAEAERLQTGARLTMRSEDKATLQKIKALGFFGLMTTGAHHQPHHLGMANGTMVH